MRKLWVSVDVEPDISEYLAGSHAGVEEGLPRILGLLEEAQVPADFFVLGEIAERFPDVVRGLAAHGAGIGSHGYQHRLLCEEPLEVQYEIIQRSLAAVEKASGRKVSMFRAPNFSANGDTIKALSRLGVAHDSSVLPGRVYRRLRVLTVYDHRGAPREPYCPSTQDVAIEGASDVMEFPVTENPFQPGTPIGLGFLNSRGVEATLRAVEAATGDYVAFLIHPWESVDLPVRERALPTWLAAAGSSDPTPLRDFLRACANRMEFATMASIAQEAEDAR